MGTGGCGAEALEAEMADGAGELVEVLLYELAHRDGICLGAEVEEQLVAGSWGGIEMAFEAGCLSIGALGGFEPAGFGGVEDFEVDDGDVCGGEGVVECVKKWADDQGWGERLG